MIDPPDEQLGEWLEALYAWDRERPDCSGVEVSSMRYGEHPDQLVEVWRPSSPGAPHGVLSIHGGYFAAEYDATLHHPMARELCRRGLTIWNVEYRKGPGAGWAATTQDVWAAAGFVAEQHGQGALAAFGHSAGGYLVESISAHPDVGLVVGMGAVTDLAQIVRLGCDEGAIEAWLGGSPDVLPEVYRNSDLTSRWPTGARHVLVHGTEDEVVPFDQSKDLAASGARAGEDYELVPLPATGHYAFLDPRSAAFEEVYAHLAAGP